MGTKFMVRVAKHIVDGYLIHKKQFLATTRKVDRLRGNQVKDLLIINLSTILLWISANELKSSRCVKITQCC